METVILCSGPRESRRGDPCPIEGRFGTGKGGGRSSRRNDPVTNDLRYTTTSSASRSVKDGGLLIVRHLTGLRSVMAEDVVVSPLTEMWAIRAWAFLRRCLRWSTRWGRRQPAILVAMLVVIVVLGAAPRIQRGIRNEMRVGRLTDLARRDVHDIVKIIGHGIVISDVRFETMKIQYAGAYYSSGDRAIVFNEGRFWTNYRLLHVAAHECVHALFDQTGLSRYSQGSRYQLIEEMTAEILAAYLAGRVMTDRGEDGDRLTKSSVSTFRIACSVDPLFSARGHLMRLFMRGRDEPVDLVEVEMILSHYGTEQLVDAIDEICRQQPDPYSVVLEVSRSFLQDQGRATGDESWSRD